MLKHIPYGPVAGLAAACLIHLVTSEISLAAPRSVAYAGEPFGVGRVTIDVLRGEPFVPLSDERFTILEANGRAIYPALKQENFRKLVRGLLDMDAPRKVTLYYLFRGDEPFDLSVFTPSEQGMRVRPIRDSAGHRRLLNEWWEQYTSYYDTVVKSGAYPPVAENFLIASLARRLNLPMPKPKAGIFSTSDKQNSPWNYLLVNEAHLLRVDREMVREQNPRQLELTTLPEPFQWPELSATNEELADIELEPMSAHVPEECFYVRFGNFSNYLWFRDLNKKWQGDLGNMILRRGIKRNAGERIQQQLSLRENAMAKILGPQVIGDAAIIGLDPYVQQGAAIGILFQAKNEVLIAADLVRQRMTSLAKFEDAKEEKFEIDGHAVSLISTPGGEVRSYYVQDDGFHLVTTSRTLVERFLQAGQGDRPLASLASFRRARREFPITRDDTVFVFVPEKFWQNLSSPQYFIENLRRVRSSREATLLELASHAAQCEGQQPGAADILPEQFSVRVDGSSIVLSENKGSTDSRRGSRGFYVPVADMTVDEASASEAQAYARFMQVMQQNVGALPPIAAAVQRVQEEVGDTQQIVVDLVAQGSLRQALGKVGSTLGQPSSNRIGPVAGDLLAVDAVVEIPSPLGAGDGAEQHLFGALRDFSSPLVIKRGGIRPGGAPTELIRGYLGAWPKPGLLSWFTGDQQAVGLEPEPIDPQIPLGGEIWQAKQEDFLLISFKPDVVRQVLPQLDLVPAERPGQLWIQLQDLTGTQLSETVNALGYMRTRDTSAAGSRMMNSLANQLHVPRHECRAIAERLIDGNFICPLGGEYQLFEPKRGLEVWASSALPESNRFLLTEVPEGFSLPMLDWFRGLTGDLRLDEQALDAHLEIRMTKAALP